METDLGLHTPAIKKGGGTIHCSYGLCNSDSRYSDREYMAGVFWIPFPKPKKNEDKCKRWIAACGRDNFTVNNVKRWTYICSKHFVGGNGPCEMHPDPIPATWTPNQIEKLSRKRKAPTPRATPVSKKTLFEVFEALLSLQSTPETITTMEIRSTSEKIQNDLLNKACCSQPEAEYFTARLLVDKETQTNYSCSDQLANKIEKRLLQNEKKSVKSKTSQKQKFTVKQLKNDEALFKFYTGITVLQFRHLFDSLGENVHTLKFWRGKYTPNKVKRKRKFGKKISAEDQLLLTLLKLRQKFPNKDLAYRFGISLSEVSSVIITWIQFLFKMIEPIWKRIFPSKTLIKETLPACFKSFKNVRIIIDCFEIFVQSSSDFAEQGNMYSSYKNHATLKCLVGIAPTGAVTFLSDVFEGSKSDREIVIASNFAEILEPGDLVIADRGFLIKDLLQKYRVDLNIPPFLNGRDRLTPQEEILTKRIARVRIHVERAIERMKTFKIIGSVLPLSFKPVATQIVKIIGFLVNYQEPLVK